jgi:hypothetical protein
MVVLREIMQLMGCTNMVLADPCPCRLIEYLLQLAPVNGKLRIGIARIATTQFAPELLSESVGVEQPIGANRDAIECVKETEFCQFFNRVWERVNTNAEFTYAARLLEHLALNADGV